MKKGTSFRARESRPACISYPKGGGMPGKVNPGTLLLRGVSCRNQRRPQTDPGPPSRPRNGPEGTDPFGTAPAPAPRGRNGTAVREAGKVEYQTTSAPPRATANPRSLLGHPRREAAAH